MMRNGKKPAPLDNKINHATRSILTARPRVGTRPRSSIRAERPRLWAPLAIALACAAPCVLPGCVSANYKFAGKDTPPAHALNVHFPPAPLEASLASVITDGGPGSWKREAFWDEYVVTLHNTGDQPLQVASGTLVDFAGTSRSAGDDPWAVERESKTLERKYRDSGMAGFTSRQCPGI